MSPRRSRVADTAARATHHGAFARRITARIPGVSPAAGFRTMLREQSGAGPASERQEGRVKLASIPAALGLKQER